MLNKIFTFQFKTSYGHGVNYCVVYTIRDEMLHNVHCVPHNKPFHLGRIKPKLVVHHYIYNSQ